MIIRQLADYDIPGIVSLVKTVWSGERIDSAQIRCALGQSHNYGLVAVDEGGRIAGFVDGFVTSTRDGRVRWEVDLLAVHSDYRGRGLATQLVKASTQTARNLGAAFARALVRIANEPAQRAFSACGYRREQPVCQLMVSTAKKNAASHSSKAQLILVDTFTYSGIWLEDDYSEDNLVAAQVACTEQRRSVAGVVIPLTRLDSIHTANALGYEPVGRFHWWLFDFER